jgi:hypothetical protein
MLPKRYAVTGALVVSLALSFCGLPSAARASTTVGVHLIDAAHYSCVGPCAAATYFSIDGIARSGAPSLRAMTVAVAGTVLSVNPDGCLAQSENWALTTEQGKNTIYLSTTADTICPTSDPNILRETGTFTITGGSGLFSTATGGGSFTWTVVVHPQIGSGTISITITD